MNVPADLRRRIEEMACDMGVPPEWVLRACIDLALKTCDDPEREHDLVIAVEAVRDDPTRSVGTFCIPVLRIDPVAERVADREVASRVRGLSAKRPLTRRRAAP